MTLAFVSMGEGKLTIFPHGTVAIALFDALLDLLPNAIIGWRKNELVLTFVRRLHFDEAFVARGADGLQADDGLASEF